jgi:hypothetical protein
MRLIEDINSDIRSIKQSIREAMVDGNDREAELLYTDLDELLEELHDAQTAFA